MSEEEGEDILIEVAKRSGPFLCPFDIAQFFLK